MTPKPLLILGLAAISLSISGCGGGVSGLGLSGGSIPTGGGTVTGKIALPSGQTLSGTTASATSLDTQKAVIVTSAVDPEGNFTVQGVPLSTDVSLTFVSGGLTLKAVVPANQVTSTKPVDIGQVDASTTVTAVAIETEVAAGIDDAATIVATQLANCSTNQDNAGETPGQQTNDIHDPTARQMSANRLIASTADSEMHDLAGKSTPQTGAVALDGILSYALASGGTVGPLTTTERQNLVTSQTAKTTYTAAQIAAALAAAGVAVDSAAVTQADRTQQQAIPSFSQFGGIAPFEAVAMAACPTSAGGFNLTAAQLSTFVNTLIAT